MKIPETSANIGAYYGNEENGQWQPNGVIIDSGVGGGVVGSGDAGLHRPVYPLHIPRGHVSGYVMAGPYYGPAGGGVGAGAAGFAQGAPPDDFADYMWMEHEEEFDKQVMQQLEEEALMEQCIEAMLEDEQRERHGHDHPTTSNGTSLSLEETVSRSTLNPLAAEFVPTRRPPKDDKTERPAEIEPETPAEDTTTDTTQAHTTTTEVTVTSQPPQEPPEVSAADVQPSDKRRDKRTDKKTPHKDKKKPQPARSDTKLTQQPKKKEAVKAVKSESRVDDVTPEPAPAAPATPAHPAAPTHPAPEVVDPAPATTDLAKPTQPSTEDLPAGPKPINYAAAAKANKPKTKPTTPPTAEKTPPPPPPDKPKDRQADKNQIKKTDKMAAKEKPVQRKNSAK